MDRILEDALMVRIVLGETPRGVAADLLERGEIKSPKQMWRTLEKWSQRGWYEYGVALDLGWLTAEGLDVARRGTGK